MRPLKATAPAARRGLQPARSATRSQVRPSFDDQTSLPAPCPASRPLYQPPIRYILSLKTIVIGRSLCFHGASRVTRPQVFPSVELQPSRGGAEKESCHPPRSQSRS